MTSDAHNDMMQAMVLDRAGQPLAYRSLPLPEPAAGQVLVKVIACGVCRTDLHIVDGELQHPKLPLIPGHEIIGMVKKKGVGVQALKEGDLVGIPWLAHTCGQCNYCRMGKENLCDDALFTGYTMNGGYATHSIAYEQYCYPIAASFANASGAPLLCAGLIGYRSYSMIDSSAQRIGIYGFGAAAHILIQVAVFEHKEIYAFTRAGDTAAQKFALSLGASWAGDSRHAAPVRLDAAIIFAPAGELIPLALAAVDKGGTVVCGGIHMSDIPSFPYRLLWEERVIRSVANLTREDATKFLTLAPKVGIHTAVQTYSLQQANAALDDLRSGRLKGAAVLVMP